MAINFPHIQGPASSATGNFEKLCAHLVTLEHNDARAVEGKGGDNGVDAFVCKAPGRPEVQTVFQFKFFTDTLDRNRKRQIEDSLRTAIKHVQPTKWVLCIPKALTPAEHRWWQELALSCKSSVELTLWDEVALRQRILLHPTIAEEFFPQKFTTTQEQQLKDMLWIRGMFGKTVSRGLQHWKPIVAAICTISFVTWAVLKAYSDESQIQQVLADASSNEISKAQISGDSATRWSAATMFHGDLQRSLAALSAVDSYSKPVGLARLAAVSVEIGNLGDASRFTQEALRATSTLDHDTLGLKALADVAVMLALAGQTGSANRLGRLVVSEVPKLPHIIENNHGMPNVEGRIREDSMRVAVEAFEITGNITDARAATIEYFHLDRPDAPFEKSRATAHPSRIFSVWSQQGSPYITDFKHSLEVETSVNVGSFEVAIKEAQLIRLQSFKTWTFERLAAQLADSGQLEKAESLRGKAFAPTLALAVAMHRSGKFTRAVELWNEAYSQIRWLEKTHPDHDGCFSQGSMALAQMGYFRRARLLANECVSPDKRLNAYTVILAEFTKHRHPRWTGGINSIVLSPNGFTPARP